MQMKVFISFHSFQNGYEATPIPKESDFTFFMAKKEDSRFWIMKKGTYDFLYAYFSIVFKSWKLDSKAWRMKNNLENESQDKYAEIKHFQHSSSLPTIDFKCLKYIPN